MPKRKSRGNGQGSAYKTPAGTWRVAVTLGYDKTGKRIYRTKSGFKTKKAALDYIPTLRNDAVSSRKLTVAALYEEWSTSHYRTLSKSKITAYRIAYNKLESIHYRDINDLKLRDLQPIVDNAAGGFYPKHDIKVVLNMMFKYAEKNDLLTKNYAQYIKLPPNEKTKKDAFTEAETQLIWNDYQDGNDFTGYILIMIYTGMRYGELAILPKYDIFLDESYMLGGIKTDAGKDREIMIPAKILSIVQKFYERNKTRLLEMSEKRFYEQYYEALERAGTRRLTPHACRHTFMTRMAERGTQHGVIQACGGHKKYETTLQYTHVSRDQKLRAVNNL